MNVFDYLFENSASLQKDFVIGDKGSIAYQKLYRDSLKVASYLREKVGQGKNIILASPNSTYFITLYLGILKSGNVCVPLNYGIEQSNLDYILDAIDCPMVFCASTLLRKLTFSELPVFSEDDLAEIIKKGANPVWEEEFDPDKIAEIIFTSGSTGKPKGVMLSHKNLMANTESIVAYLKLTEADIMGVVLPFFYCYGLSLLHTHLRVGGSIVLNNSFIFLGSVINDLKKYRCTGFAGVPSHFQVLLKKSKTFKTTDFPDLRYVTQAGGKLHAVFIDEFARAFPNVDFYVMYGQTEATARLTYLEPNMIGMRSHSIGKAIPGVEIKIVGKDGQEVGVQEEGELVARGDNIMSGYFRDLENTKQTIKDGWLYTGDIAIRDEEGYLYIVGRQKEIIKVGGKRISPKEIEAVILSVSNVIDCTVQGIEDELLGEALEATVVTANPEEEEVLKERILKKCAKELVTYKIPRHFVFNKSMSLSLTGKKIKAH
ncbi:AMP-binding protein [Lentiprolixibacter aurantiacus]|uniref:AMP-binding protein n=1 Tax=Lentiprolixibacter aurantiacus TaxID=2993939 RepID=A0AAE3ML79_9FLAO|nr:AMP-binding protein [Lentiprolixibacter aurantiacus]MCX2719875.1 AMP-binding protein [Lentiprolixibacter aurantiacus]